MGNSESHQTISFNRCLKATDVEVASGRPNFSMLRRGIEKMLEVAFKPQFRG
jgi:hypothetical protein